MESSKRTDTTGTDAAPGDGTDRLQTFYNDYVHYLPNDDFGGDRLRIVGRLISPKSRRFLDVGCGRGRNLLLARRIAPEADLHGIDISASVEADLAEFGFVGKSCDASVRIDYPDNFFDTVLCGEVIEHVIDTDTLVAELRRVLQPSGRLILTTPNLAYALNRVLLAFGVQPFFTETSLTKVLGRRHRALGQGNRTQGHLKIFTKAALVELLTAAGFRVEKVYGHAWIHSGLASHLDRIFALNPALAAGFVVSSTAIK